MDNNTNNINDNGNLDNQTPKNQKGFMSKASDFIDDYRNVGSLKAMAQNALKDKAVEKINDKKDQVKERINDKISAKLPESVQRKRAESKSKNDAVNNKKNNQRTGGNNAGNPLNQAKAKINEQVFRKGVKTAVNSFAPGVGEVAEKVLDTPKGEEAVEAARAASNPATGLKDGAKKLVEIIVKDTIKKKSIAMLPAVIVLVVIFMLMFSMTSKAGSSYDYFRGDASGNTGMDAIDEEYKEFYEAVEKYGTANKAMVVAVLTAHTDNDEYIGNISEKLESCTTEEIESGDCFEETGDSGITTYSKSKIKKYIKKVNKAIQDSGGDVSEGDYDDPQNTGSKFFKWLYNDFVEDYYKKYVTDDKSKAKIIREIYLFYKELKSGSGDCSNSFVNLTCPQVTVTGTGAGTYALEDYIAGVVANELGYSGYPQAIRAQAIAARTYLFAVTDNCQLSIENSTNAQTMNMDRVNEEIKQAVQETAGMVLTKDGKVFMSQYSTFSPNMSCSGSVCTGTFYKQPSNTATTITIDVSKIGFPTSNLLGGHEYGMSQYGALYLDQVESKNYKDILKTFYDEETEISSTTTSNVTGAGGYCGATDGGLVQLEGYAARLSRPARNNAFYYDQSSNLGANGWLEGECAWYASGRAQEILSTLGSDVTWTFNGDGGTYCDSMNYDKDKFQTSTDVYSPRPGAIISWKDGSYGHVAVVEKVEGNSVTISQAGLGFGPTEKYGCSTGSCVRPYVTGTLADRRTYCESDGSGCFNMSTLDISALQNYSGLNFQCYIYLGSKK